MNIRRFGCAAAIVMSVVIVAGPLRQAIVIGQADDIDAAVSEKCDQVAQVARDAVGAVPREWVHEQISLSHVRSQARRLRAS